MAFVTAAAVLACSVAALWGKGVDYACAGMEAREASLEL